MKTLLLFVLIAAGHLTNAQNTDADKINALHKRKFAWLINKQYDSLELVLDNNLRYLHSNGWIQSKREVIDDLKIGKPVYFNVTVEESSVTLYNGTAVVVGKGVFKGKQADQTEFNVHLLYTEVYVKTKKLWQLVSRQATKI